MKNTPSALIATMCENIVGVQVQFKDHLGEPFGKCYTYLSTNTNIEEGDSVVVDAPNTGLTVVTVASVDPNFEIVSNVNYKFLVQKVDTTQYDSNMEALTQAVETLRKLQRRAAAKKQMLEIAETLGDDGAAALEEVLGKLK